MSPHEIARMLTSDPDIINEAAARWQKHKQLTADELELGDVMYCVTFTIGATITPGEKAVMYYRNGDGYPGSPPSIEWDILSIDEAEGYDQNGEVISQELTDDLSAQLKEALLKKITDEDIANAVDDGPPDDADYRYEQRYDR